MFLKGHRPFFICAVETQNFASLPVERVIPRVIPRVERIDIPRVDDVIIPFPRRRGVDELEIRAFGIVHRGEFSSEFANINDVGANLHLGFFGILVVICFELDVDDLVLRLPCEIVTQVGVRCGFGKGVAPFSVTGGEVTPAPELDVRASGFVGHAVVKRVAYVHDTVPVAINQHREDFVIRGAAACEHQRCRAKKQKKQ